MVIVNKVKGVIIRKAEDWQIKRNILASRRAKRLNKLEPKKMERMMLKDKPARLKMIRDVKMGKYKAREHPYYKQPRGMPMKSLIGAIKYKVTPRIPISTTRAREYMIEQGRKKGIIKGIPLSKPTPIKKIPIKTRKEKVFDIKKILRRLPS